MCHSIQRHTSRVHPCVYALRALCVLAFLILSPSLGDSGGFLQNLAGHFASHSASLNSHIRLFVCIICLFRDMVFYTPSKGLRVPAQLVANPQRSIGTWSQSIDKIKQKWSINSAAWNLSYAHICSICGQSNRSACD